MKILRLTVLLALSSFGGILLAMEDDKEKQVPDSDNPENLTDGGLTQLKEQGIITDFKTCCNNGVYTDHELIIILKDGTKIFSTANTLENIITVTIDNNTYGVTNPTKELFNSHPLGEIVATENDTIDYHTKIKNVLSQLPKAIKDVLIKRHIDRKIKFVRVDPNNCVIF